MRAIEEAFGAAATCPQVGNTPAIVANIGTTADQLTSDSSLAPVGTPPLEVEPRSQLNISRPRAFRTL